MRGNPMLCKLYVWIHEIDFRIFFFDEKILEFLIKIFRPKKKKKSSKRSSISSKLFNFIDYLVILNNTRYL